MRAGFAFTGVWISRRSNTNDIIVYQFGVSTDKVVPADYDGDGKTDIAVFGMSRMHFCGPGKNSRSIMAKEVLILTGRDAGATITEIAEIAELDTSTVSRRYDDASQSLLTDSKLAYATELVKKQYQANIAVSQE